MILEKYDISPKEIILITSEPDKYSYVCVVKFLSYGFQYKLNFLIFIIIGYIGTYMLSKKIRVLYKMYTYEFFTRDNKLIKSAKGTRLH